MHRFILNCLVLLALNACAPPHKVAVEERKTISTRVEAERIGGTHIRYVAPGDTLHAIAFINGLNVNELAAWNNLDDTSKLRVGQRIRLTEPLNFVAKESATKPAVVSVVETQPDNGVAKPLEDRPIAAEPLPEKEPLPNSDVTKPEPEPVATATPTTNTNVAVAPPQGDPTKKVEQTVEPTPKPITIEPVPSSQLTWYWPTQGKVITRFANHAGQQGIDIQGKLGQAVNAVGAGQVVYVGDGLKGYGNLVIIKHNDQFLSAYAHNQETFVLEGQQVAAKQRIALLGKNNRQQNALHFQIRKDGQPVDPLKFLR